MEVGEAKHAKVSHRADVCQVVPSGKYELAYVTVACLIDRVELELAPIGFGIHWKCRL